MKKLISLGLVGVMALSMVPTALATNTYDQDNTEDMSTLVTYNAQDPDGDGVLNYEEAYTITVPAYLTPGGEAAQVTVEGTLPSNRELVVGITKDTVTLTSDVSDETWELGVNFDTLYMGGNDYQAVGNHGDISVEAIENPPMFGNLMGTIVYTAEIG